MKVMSVAEAARFCRVCEATIRRAAESGDLKRLPAEPTLHGRKRSLFDKAEVERFRSELKRKVQDGVAA